MMLCVLYWKFLWDRDPWADSCFYAGALFGEVGWWLLMLRALYWTFHVRQGSIIRFIFLWPAQYLANWGDESCCSAHCTGHVICEEDPSWDSFFVAGAMFGEVGVSLFVAGAGFREILGDSRSEGGCVFPYEMHLQGGTSKVSKSAGARWRSPALRIILSLSRSNLELRIWWQAQHLVRFEGDFSCSADCKWRFICDGLQSWEVMFRGRHSIWWGSRVTSVVPRIVHDVSYVRGFNHESDFSWQAQYLVRFEGDFGWSAHCKWLFICEGLQSWEWFFVAGAVLFGGLGVWLLRINHESHVSWQVRYLVKYRKMTPFAVRTGRFISLADQSWDSCFVAGAVFNLVKMDDDTWCSAYCTGSFYETGIHEQIHVSMQAHYLVKLDDDSWCSAHCPERFMWDKEVPVDVYKSALWLDYM